MTAPHTGGCRCGAVRFAASAAPGDVTYCHCVDCRRASGAPVSAFAGFMADDVTASGEAPKTFENGPVTRSFCGVCGSPIAYADARLPGRIWLVLGAMDAPENYKPTLHAYAGQQLPYLHMDDGLPRLQRTSVPRPDGNAA